MPLLLFIGKMPGMKSQSKLAGVSIGLSSPVRLMGVINVSAESFFKQSVGTQTARIAAMARELTKEGADFIDVGAMSSAPYLKTHISESIELERLTKAISVLRKNSKLPISADTSRARVADAALKAGAKIINDVTGFMGDPAMALVARRAQGIILMAHPSGLTSRSNESPVFTTIQLFRQSLKLARQAGVPLNKIALDPGIGFFRGQKLPWWKWDLEILKELKQLTKLDLPLLIGASRKSFIGHILDQKDPHDRLAGSLAAATVAVLNGASIIRTHDVDATRQAVKIAQQTRGELNPLI